MSERFLSHPSVRHVASCLEAAGHQHGVIALDDTARSAEEAAAALGVETGAIVKTLVFTAGDPETPVIALVAALVIPTEVLVVVVGPSFAPLGRALRYLMRYRGIS